MERELSLLKADVQADLKESQIKLVESLLEYFRGNAGRLNDGGAMATCGSTRKLRCAPLPALCNNEITFLAFLSCPLWAKSVGFPREGFFLLPCSHQ